MPQSFRFVVHRGALAAAAALVIAALGAGAAQAAIGPTCRWVTPTPRRRSCPTPPAARSCAGARPTTSVRRDPRAVASSFTDASCSSATTVDMTQSQSLEGGCRPPRPSSTRSSQPTHCDRRHRRQRRRSDRGRRGVRRARRRPAVRDRVQDHYASGGSDPNVAAINATGPKVAAVIQGIHARAPQAEVMVVGYPDGLPTNGSVAGRSCRSPRRHHVHQLAGDVAQHGAAQRRRRQRRQVRDTFTSSIGHDACKSSGTAWVNGIIPTSAAFPLHPNQRGEQNMANQVLADR